MVLERHHVIVAAIVGVVSWTVITTALPSLRWIPYALVAGCLVTVGGILFLLATTARPVRHGARSGPRIAVPAFVTPALWDKEKAALNARSAYSRSRIYPASRKISSSIDALLDLVQRDYITGWYRNISSRPLFQNEVDRAIRDAAGNIQDRLSDLDLVEMAVLKIVPVVTNHIKDFYDAERLVRGKNLSRGITESEELDLAIAAKYRDGKLHPAASLSFSDTKLMQQAHLRTIVARVLPAVLSDDMKSSPAVTTLVREIVSCAVLAPIMLMLTDPDFWNQLVDNFGRSLLQDRKTVRKLRAALDEHAPSSKTGSRPTNLPHLRPSDNERQFERFIRATRHVGTLSDARRLKSEVTSQIRKATSTPDQDPVYIRRLEAGRRMLDQQIAALSAGSSATPRPKLRLNSPATSSETLTKWNRATLKDVLHNASGLSYFMEFMDRRDKMRQVQFWIVVDGFRNPLEEDTDEPGQALQEKTAWTAADRMDIAQINEAYMGAPELSVSEHGRRAVDAYLRAGRAADAEAYVSARRAVLQAQTAVFEEMKDQHFEAFKKSDLFYKWLATDEGSSQAAGAETTASMPRSVSDAGSRNNHKASRSVNPATPQRLKDPDLRRAAMSSTDLHAPIRPALSSSLSRRSIDGSTARPLFDDDVDDERLSRSVPALSNDSDEHHPQQRAGESAQVVDAMQVALNEIMDEPDRDSLFGEPSVRPGTAAESPRISEGAPWSPVEHKSKPSIASLGLIGGPSSRGVFTDDLFEEEEKFLEDEKDDSDVNEKPVEDDIHEAAPGDLGLAEAIDTLNANIERLAAQEQIVDSLTRKAELTNNAAELRILRKSKQSLQREVHRKEMQKQQYIVQESDNGLYGKAAVSIKSVMVGKEEDGHEFAIYVIEVRRQAGDQMPAAVWTVARRYSEFHEMHKRLRSRFKAVKDLEFPRRQTIFTLQKDFLQKRRIVLERYLRALLLLPAICRSRELRAFLSQSAISTNGSNGTKIDAGDFVTRIYNSVSDGMEEFLGNLPALDQLSVAGQNLISAASAQMNGAASVDPALQDPATAAEAEAEMKAFEDRTAEPFVKPICDLFLEAFELQKGSSWLRGHAVVVVLHQLLGGTIERKVREAAKGFTQEEPVLRCLELLREMMWPGGKMRPPSVPRSQVEKTRSQREASLLLATLVPDMAAGVVGRANAQAASRKIFAVLNNQRLNTHLVFTLFDELVQIVFPEAAAR